eukprot:g3792.t1
MMSTPRACITFVTGNKNKLAEVVSILKKLDASFPYDLRSLKIDLPEIQSGDPDEIAREKCRRAAKIVGGAVIVEDTSLHFKALGGLPGPFIKFFLQRIGHDGLNNLLAAYKDKSAHAQCTFGFTEGAGKDVHVFAGKTSGTIVAARGPTDFGWDPIFEPVEGGGRTYAEMSKEKKNAISHRYRALVKLCGFLTKPKEGGGRPTRGESGAIGARCDGGM